MKPIGTAYIPDEVKKVRVTAEGLEVYIFGESNWFGLNFGQTLNVNG